MVNELKELESENKTARQSTQRGLRQSTQKEYPKRVPIQGTQIVYPDKVPSMLA